MKNFNSSINLDSTLVAPTNKSHSISGTSDPVPMVKLLGRYAATAAFYKLIQQQAEEGMQTLEHNTLYMCSEICGDGFWIILTKREKWLAGRCFAHMVYMGMFPLSFVQYKRSATKRYRLI